MSAPEGVKVDSEDQWLLDTYKWCLTTTKRPNRYACRREGSRLVMLHRSIVDAPVGIPVDHINGDSLDNRRANLRLCTHTENTRNRKPVGGSSQYTGVCWDTARRKYMAYVDANGRRYLGRFDDEATAAKARDAVAATLHGEFARLNFP